MFGEGGAKCEPPAAHHCTVRKALVWMVVCGKEEMNQMMMEGGGGGDMRFAEFEVRQKL